MQKKRFIASLLLAMKITILQITLATVFACSIYANPTLAQEALNKPVTLTVREVATLSAVVYAVFWILGGSVMVASRLGKRSGRQLPPRSAPGASG